jgi:hypothetical protein
MTAAGLRLERADTRHFAALTSLFARRFYVYNYRLAAPSESGPQE